MQPDKPGVILLDWLFGGVLVAAVFSAEEILEIVDGRLAAGMMPDEAGEICSDTRALSEGQWFLALTGKEFDGHDFLGDAFSAGAIGCIVEERANYPIASSSFPLLAVGNTEDAASRLARNWRRRLNPRVVLMVRSGTETAEIAAHFQNHNGDPNHQTTVLRNADWQAIVTELLALEQNIASLVIEYAANNAGEVKAVAEMVAPNMVLLPVDALSQLRIQASESELTEAFKSLINCLERQRGQIIISDQIELDLEKHASADQLTRWTRFADQSVVATLTAAVSNFLHLS